MKVKAVGIGAGGSFEGHADRAWTVKLTLQEPAEAEIPAEDKDKYREEFENFQQDLDKKKEEFQKEHPDIQGEQSMHV